MIADILAIFPGQCRQPLRRWHRRSYGRHQAWTRVKARRVEKLLADRTRQHFGKQRWHGIARSLCMAFWPYSRLRPSGNVCRRRSSCAVSLRLINNNRGGVCPLDHSKRPGAPSWYFKGTSRSRRLTCCLIVGGYRRNATINGNIKSSSIKNAIKPKQSQPIPTSRKPTARTGEWGEYRIFSPAW
jgi:hypothetical protein